MRLQQLPSEKMPNLKLHDIQLNFLVSAFTCPQVQRNARQFVDHRICEPRLREIDSFQVALATVAALYAYMLKLSGRVDGQQVVIFFAAVGTYDSPEGPLCETERT